jgi:AAA+ superfamily predicted ATPase
VGPPGNGKTSIAEGLAEALMTPFFTVHYEALIGSYLGETAQRLKSLFEYISSRECVLFLDEFDVLGKERGDIHETGEIKRVVSSLLLQMDALPTHVVVVAATNHPELLDRAVWRRFQLRLEVQPPDQNQFGQWLKLFRKTLPEKLPTSDEILRNHLMGLSFSELEDFRLDVLRRYILKIPEDSLSGIIRVVLKELALTVKPVIDEASLHGVS